MKPIISIILICWTLTKYMAEAYYYHQSDFAKVKETSYFIDKTLLIKDFIDEDGSVKVITAPSKFGKSTIINMIKRFTGIQINRNSSDMEPVHYKGNLNYAVFCETPLKICRESEFMEKHFGRYPVVQISYSRLKCLWNFESILTAMREILLETYAQHPYLLEESLIWPVGELSQEHFRMITNRNIDLTKSEIEVGFKLLAEILHNYFERKVIILVDEYDVYWENLLFRKVSNETEVTAFLTAINEQLFKCNTHFYRALLTGTVNIKDTVTGSPGNSRNYRFLADHVFSKYYGFTAEEIKEMATKSDAPIDDSALTTSLKRYYDGYLVRSRNVTVYNPFSVITFFARRMKYGQYWIQTNFLDGISEVYKAPLISDAMKNLLIGATVNVNVARPFESDQLLRLCRIHENLELLAEPDVELVFRYFFDLGRLSPTIADASSSGGPVALKVANTEVQMEFGRLLRKNHQTSYAISTADIQVYQEAFNHFEPGKNMSEAFIFFTRSTFNFFFENSKNCPTSENDIQSILLAFAAEKFKLGSTWNEEKPEKIEILVLNDHNIAVILGTKFQRENDKHERFTSGQLAQKALSHVKDKYRERSYVQSLLQVENVQDIKYIGLGYREDNKGISTAS